jgi:hypothetical protein
MPYAWSGTQLSTGYIPHNKVTPPKPAHVKVQQQPSEKPAAIDNSANALTKCRSCNGVVAWEARSCPHCGQRKPAGKRPQKNLPRSAVVGTFVAIAALIVIAASEQVGAPVAPPTIHFGPVAAFDGTSDSISAALTYAAMLGRATACGVDTTEMLDKVGRWMGDAGPVIAIAVAERIQREAALQHSGKTPDTCAAVRQTVSKVTWPE